MARGIEYLFSPHCMMRSGVFTFRPRSGNHTVYCNCGTCSSLPDTSGRNFSPTAFEHHVGSGAKKWKYSIKARAPNGAEALLGMLLRNSATHRDGAPGHAAAATGECCQHTLHTPYCAIFHSLHNT